MSAQIIPFRYEGQRELRTVLIDGEPWFVAADVAAILGYRMASDMTRALDDDEKGTHRTRTPSGDQDLLVISEGGMWRVIVQRQVGRMDDGPREAVKSFQRWVTHTVLPEIRKTGAFGVAALPQSYPEALRALAAEAEAHELAKLRIVELEPAARAWHNIASAAGDFEVGDAAKMLSRDPSISIGQRKLFEWMELHGWIFRRQDGRPRAYQHKIDAGLLAERVSRPYLNERTGNYESPAPQVRVTPKGMDRLYAALGGAEAVA